MQGAEEAGAPTASLSKSQSSCHPRSSASPARPALGRIRPDGALQGFSLPVLRPAAHFIRFGIGLMAGTRTKPRRRPRRPPKRAPTSAQLVRLLAHPLRRRILRTIHGVGEARSSRELALALDAVLSNVSYHVRVLRDARALVLTDSLPVRGSMESFYASAVEGDRWLRLFLDATRRQDGEG